MYQEPMTQQMRIDNSIDQVTRMPVEWGLGNLAENWKSLCYHKRYQLKLREVKQDVICCVLLTNALTLRNGCQSIRAFTRIDDPFLLIIPTLEMYLE